MCGRENLCAGYGVRTAPYCADDIYSLIKCVIDLMTYMYSTNSVSNIKKKEKNYGNTDESLIDFCFSVYKLN